MISVSFVMNFVSHEFAKFNHSCFEFSLQKSKAFNFSYFELNFGL